MRLLERGDALDQAAEALARARAGRGSVLLLSGEAGLGKSSLIAELLRTLQGSRLRVLQGGCEDLHAPRPLGPVHEIARGGLVGVQALLARHEPAAEVAAALLAALDVPHQPTLLVVEDLHWADDATLDLLKHAGRRIARLPVLLLLSYRDDELGPEHPLNSLLGDLPAEACVRLALAPLRVVRWPYPGAIAIVEESDGLRQRHLVDRWCYLGTGKPRGKKAPQFDIDVYNILQRPLAAGGLNIEPV